MVAIFGTSSGMFNALVTIIPQYLCPYGYSDVRDILDYKLTIVFDVARCGFMDFLAYILWFDWSYVGWSIN